MRSYRKREQQLVMITVECGMCSQLTNNVKLGTFYMNTVSFVTALLSMQLRLSLTRRRWRPLLKTCRFENVVKSGAWTVFNTIRFCWSCKRQNRIDLKTVMYFCSKLARKRRVNIANLVRRAALAYTITLKTLGKRLNRLRVNTSKPCRFRCGFEVIKSC